ncbi:UDP-3-O-(3-hydroxymyristoyl)glucosamine N-acyltransferase [Muribaculaceae bacterium Isolate-002 (NCI)]|nr:UDP-3-O-(3-hydroxymyristoyl)glucosamine N-acyltransferase [Muribaculaceae bacterium Isolate-002 (NCI)]
MQFSANQIAQLTGGTVVGDGEVTVSTVAKIEEGHPGAISFLANPKYTHFIYDTASSIVLVRNDFEPERPVAATLIKVADPYATVASLLQMVASMTEPQYSGIESPSYIAEGVELPDDVYVGAFAYIGRGAIIGRGVKIFPQAYIGDNVVIGDNTVIKPGVKIYHNCRIGKRCIIHGGAVIGADGFGFAPVNNEYSKIPQIGNVELADDVEIGANTCIDRATMGSTRISRGVKLDNLIQVAHNVEIGENTVMAAQVGIAGSTKIGARCMVAGQVGFAGHITVGNDNQIGAQSGVPNSVGSGKRLMGYPVVEARDFARNLVYLKNIPAMQKRISALEKELRHDSQQG